jgi:ATP synthase protein I
MSATTPPKAATAGGPFGAMLRGAFLPTLLVGPVAVAVAALASGGRSALGAALGFGVSIGFFALGLLVMQKLDSAADPLRFLASALAVFFGQMIFLLLVIVALQHAAWLDGTAFGLTALAVALVWQVFQILAFVRSRRPDNDAAPLSPAGEPDHPHDRPADQQDATQADGQNEGLSR